MRKTQQKSRDKIRKNKDNEFRQCDLRGVSGVPKAAYDQDSPKSSQMHPDLFAAVDQAGAVMLVHPQLQPQQCTPLSQQYLLS